MSTAVFRRGVSSRYADVSAERTWMLVSTGEFGTAKIVLPYSADAASSTYIDPDGGSWVEIASEAGSGDWIGIITNIEYDAQRMIVSASQPQSMLGRRIMHWESSYRHPAPVGYYVGKVLREALPGLPWLWSRYLPADACDPVIRNYQLNGQDAWSIILELMEQSNSELFVNGETGEVTWEGALAGDQFQAELIADGNLHNWSYRASVEGRASEIVVKSGTYRHWVSSGDAAISYPAQKIITVGAVTSGASSADLELIRAKGAQITVEGGVDEDYWYLRERNFVRILFPQAGMGGVEHPCRILGRTLTDDSNLMQLTLQVIIEDVGVRVSPPMRSASTGLSGATGTGSWAQRERAQQRSQWNRWLEDN